MSDRTNYWKGQVPEIGRQPGRVVAQPVQLLDRYAQLPLEVLRSLFSAPAHVEAARIRDANEMGTYRRHSGPCATSARILHTAVGFCLVPPTEPELRLLHRWLDSWRGVGDVVTGMNRQGYWLLLSNVDAGTWRATFSRDAMISADGFGADATPWRATQGAA